MQTTTNFAFRKPDPTDNYAIEDQNTNWDTADTQIKSAQTAAAAAETTANAAIPSTQKAAADGVATLDATIKVPIAQIPNMDLAHLPTGIPATKLADGSITDTELEYINSLTSNAQTQITAIKTTADAAATNAALIAHEADYTLQVPYGGATTGPANTYALATPAIAALSVGMAVSVKFNVDSTGASTLNWNGKGAKGIKKANGTDVTNLKATGIYTLRYDGVNFTLQGEGGEYGTAGAPQVFPGYTVGTENGLVPGTATADATAGAGDLANGKTAYINGAKVTGTGANARRFATGTVTSTSSLVAFTYEGGGTTNMYSLVVSGLGFTPSQIFIGRNGSVTDWGVFLQLNDGNAVNHYYTLTTWTAGASTTLTGLNFNTSVAPASISNGGFTLPVINFNIVYTFLAYE